MIESTAIVGGFVLIPTLVLAMTVFWIWMLIDCANHETDQGRKIAWMIMIAITHWLGATIYYFFGRRRVAA